jgi:hypothetical protein
MKMLPHPQFTQQTHPLRTRFELPTQINTKCAEFPTRQGARRHFAVVRARCAAVSQTVRVGENSAGLAFLRRLENPVGFPSYYGRPIATTLRTILPYRFDSSFHPTLESTIRIYSCHPDGFSSSQSEAHFHPTQQNMTTRVRSTGPNR